MLTSVNQVPMVEEKTPEPYIKGQNSVDVDLKDTVGAVFLGILSFILLVGWMRAEARNRALMNRQYTD